jgi:hypothetical protein
MEFRLTYEGPLLGAQSDARLAHKRDIRRKFHVQLKRLWEINPYLKHGYPVEFDWKSSSNPKTAISYHTSIAEWLAPRYRRNGYTFVPLVRQELSLICSLEILFLRPDVPGNILASGDIDNRIKTLFDALRLPKGQQELVDYNTPPNDENPFFCLLEDDSLITKVSVEADMLLEPIDSTININDARLVIRVGIRPFNINPSNENFA